MIIPRKFRVETASVHSSSWAAASPEQLDVWNADQPLQESFIHELKLELEFSGCALLNLVDSECAPVSLIQILGVIGIPIRVFKKFNFWRPIGVDLDKDPERSEGVGIGPFHLDFVNASEPPAFVCLYCEREDPLGGGATVISSISDAIDLLSEEDRNYLRRPVFSDGKVEDLDNVGTDVNPFPVLAEDTAWPYRYTGSLRSLKLLRPGARRALNRLDEELRNGQIEFHIPAGSALVFSNSRYVHARQALGIAQASVSPAARRLLHQAFAKSLQS